MVLQALEPSARPQSHAGANAHGVAVDDSILGLADSPVDRSLEQMLHWAADEFGDELVVKAKNDFYWKNGKVFPDDEFYPSRMTYFVDQFLFQFAQTFADDDRRLSLYELFKEEHEPTAIKGVRHSIYKVKSFADDKLRLVDLLSHKQLTVKKRANETFFGIKKRLIMQGYIYYCGDDAFLSQGLVVHPQVCTKQILRYIADVQDAGRYDSAAVLSRFARLQLRHKRHRHVDPTVIYLTDAR